MWSRTIATGRPSGFADARRPRVSIQASRATVFFVIVFVIVFALVASSYRNYSANLKIDSEINPAGRTAGPNFRLIASDEVQLQRGKCTGCLPQKRGTRAIVFCFYFREGCVGRGSFEDLSMQIARNDD